MDVSDTKYPEGGIEAWSVVLGAWCAMIPSMGLLNSLGILHAWTNNHQLANYSESSIGWIYGAYGFFLYAAGAQTGKSVLSPLEYCTEKVLGPIFDTYGPRYVIIPGSVGIVVALICLSFSEGNIASCPSIGPPNRLNVSRVLPDIPFLQRFSRTFRECPVHSDSFLCGPLVQQA
jgi:MFS family permease